MIANTAFLAAVTTFLIVAWLAGELSYLSQYETALFRLHGVRIGIVTVLIFLNLCGVYYWIARILFLRDTGRKLRHLDRQLGTADGVIDRQDMASNQLLSHALEQLLSRSKRQRDTEAATINMQLVTWRDGRAANEAFVAGTGDALRTWRQP